MITAYDKKEINVFFIPYYTYNTFYNIGLKLEDFDNISLDYYGYTDKGIGITDTSMNREFTKNILNKLKNNVSYYDMLEISNVNSYLYNKLFDIDLEEEKLVEIDCCRTYTKHTTIENFKYLYFTQHDKINPSCIILHNNFFENGGTEDILEDIKINKFKNSIYEFMVVNKTIFVIYNKGFGNLVSDKTIIKQFGNNILEEFFIYLCDKNILKSAFFQKLIMKYLNTRRI